MSGEPKPGAVSAQDVARIANEILRASPYVDCEARAVAILTRFQQDVERARDAEWRRGMGYADNETSIMPDTVRFTLETRDEASRERERALAVELAKMTAGRDFALQRERAARTERDGAWGRALDAVCMDFDAVDHGACRMRLCAAIERLIAEEGK